MFELPCDALGPGHIVWDTQAGPECCSPSLQLVNGGWCVCPLLKWTAVSLIEVVVVLKPLDQLWHLQM